jgi:eukaryotic-like serine/threonine-protein kinase
MAERLILNRYRLVERLAAGGSAEVWRARDEQLGRDVAVKRLHPHLVPDDPSRKRLTAEARAAAGLSHPVIVGIYDVDSSGESPALVMELVDGESLAARIGGEGPLPAREAAAVAADVADALFHAHQRGVIHRDVKPGNVLLSRDGRTRLVDFGIAHSLSVAAERLTVTGTVIGTLHAMAPEQLSDGPITPRTDLYGLGVVLHEAVTGRPPYPSTSPVALADAQRAGPPDLTGVDPALAAVIAACLAFDPSDRPLHAGATANALRAWLAGDPAPALALAPAHAAADDASAATLPRPAVVMPAQALDASPPGRRAAAPPPTAGGPRRRRGGWVPAALGAGLILLAIAAFAAWGPDLGPPSGAGGSPSPSMTPADTPSDVPMSRWLPRLADEIRESCGDGAAAAATLKMASMSRAEAQEDARKTIRDCQEEGGDD